MPHSERDGIHLVIRAKTKRVTNDALGGVTTVNIGEIQGRDAQLNGCLNQIRNCLGRGHTSVGQPHGPQHQRTPTEDIHDVGSRCHRCITHPRHA